MGFYKVWHTKKNMRVIYARSSYEATGFYLIETDHDCDCVEHLIVQKLSTSVLLKVMHNGFETLRTLQDICSERKFDTLPCTVVEILK
ncbi:hypothetical protein IRV17_28415 [Bacillus cereus]|uniref:hypothetical protein n=1 Tax=Bacillus cereus TaxID=1396 RepID=UPI00192518D4|nr:hypothetical protein [Bacillus cereus]MBL3881606.1 hypothetical protein [Bacillus cereus]HDR8481918.1 hypothetical protein [Bacillus cereus]